VIGGPLGSGARPTAPGVGTIGSGGVRTGPSAGVLASGANVVAIEMTGRLDNCADIRASLALSVELLDGANSELAMCRWWAEITGGDCSEQEAAVREAEEAAASDSRNLQWCITAATTP
jgi:hypothetical protein